MGTRKNFIQKGVLFLTGSIFGQTKKRNNEVEQLLTSDYKAELFKNSIKKEYDLIVVGAGISGITAAISAARNGVKVALVHNRSMFGGSSSSEVKLMPEPNHRFQPWIKEGGIHEEILLEDRIRNHMSFTGNNLNATWDLVLYEWIHKESNIDSYLNTHMHRPIMANESTIESIFCIQLGSNKDYLLSAPLYVDATGDGNLGYFAGADFREGRESKDEYNESLAPEKPDNYHMGNTFYFNARDVGKPVPYKRPGWVAKFESEEDLIGRGHHNNPGADVISGYWWLEIATPYHWIEDMNEGRHEGLRQLLGVWDHLKNQGNHGIENYGLEFVGTWPYKRDTKRILGDYVVSQHDVQNPQKLKDAVAYGAWYIDLHNKGGILARDNVPAWEYFHTVGAMVYGIPLRALYSRNINNMFTCDRSISCSYLAFGSSRVLSTGAICGEAVGVAASLALKYDKKPKEIAEEHVEECQQIIIRQDGHIPGIKNQDPNDIARRANVTVSSSESLSFPIGEGERELNIPHAQIFPVTNNRIKKIKLYIRSEKNDSINLRLGLRHAPSVWDFRSEKDIAESIASIPANFNGWVEFDFNIKVSTNKFYYIYTDSHKSVYWKHFQDSHDEPTHTPLGTTAARQPVKPPYSEHPKSFREIYPPTSIEDLPGAGKTGFWEPLTNGQCLAMQLDPNSYPYEGENINTGTNRPDTWTNIWISDEQKKLPAWFKFKWSSSQLFDTIHLTFDTNQNYRVTNPLYRYPECVKDYVIEYRKGGNWKELLKVEDNYMRKRIHHFDSVQTDELRVTILETNGVKNARIYEMRVYNLT